MRRQAAVAVMSVVGMVLGPVAAHSQESDPAPSPAQAQAELLSTDPADEDQEELVAGPLAGLLDHLGALTANTLTAETFAPPAFRVEAPSHVTMLTTGVDLSALGDRAGAVTVTSRGGADGSDAVGWGTWATSVLLQAAPATTVDLVDVYADDLPNLDAIARALEAIDPTSTDAVLLAFPPGDVLDPTSRLLASGRADQIFDAALDTIVTQADGSKVVGIPLDDDARAAAEYVGGWSDLRDVRNAARMIRTWEQTSAAITSLVLDGIPVVAPAGDLGPTPQSVLGVAGLPDVIAVGAADAQGNVSATSARGPSLHGMVKPDVVAPVVFAGLLPEASDLADVLGVADLLDAALPVALTGDVVGMRTASTSTIAAAAEVVASLAVLHAAGVTDRGVFAGELLAAAVPTAQRDVLAEGAGVLEQLPTAELVGTRPTVAGTLDLGMEPDDVAAPWTATVEVLGGAAQVPTVELDRLVATGLDGRREATEVAPTDRPVVGSTVVTGGSQSGDGALTLADGRITLDAVPGDNSWEAGAFCGYSRVDLIGTSTAVDTQVGVGTGPVVVPEDVPTCLVEGMRLDVLNFYIHNLPAQDFTLALLPNLPAGMDLLEGPTMVLPVHPTKERLYSRVSGPDGYATFGAVVPGFYRMRQFSDYSIDVAESHPGGTINRDLGSPLTYSQKDALVLPDTLCQVAREDRGGAPDPCHVEQLTPIDGDGEVGYDKTTGRYLVDLPEIGEQGVILGWAKKMQLTVVSSRYVDVMGGADWTTDSPQRTAQEVVELLADLSQIDQLRDVGQPLAAAADALLEDASTAVGAALGLGDLWTWTAPPGGGEALVGSYAGLSAEDDPASVVGIADYPFALTTPNYRGSFDWNFTYDVEDVALIAVVEVGRERHVALFSPAGVTAISPIGTEQPIDPVGLLGVSRADGVARLDYTTHPKGAPSGTITLLAIPMDPMDPATLQLAEQSMEITTWQRVEWPPTKHDRDGVQITGHAFEVQPRYADFDQMTDGGRCRNVAADLTGGFAGEVCEEWNLITHSGKHDVETFRILDGVSGDDVTAEVAPAGGLFHDPMHGVTDATLAVAHAVTLDPLAVVDQDVRRELRSNGAFFEMLRVPTAVVAAHPESLIFQQADNIAGRHTTTITEHRTGPVPLSGYLRFATRHGNVTSQLPVIADEPPSATAPTAMSTASRRGSGDAGAAAGRDFLRGFGALALGDDPVADVRARVDAARAEAGVDAITVAHDLDELATDWAAVMIASGQVGPSPSMGDDACCWDVLEQVDVAVDGEADLGRAAMTAIDQALATPAQAAIILAADADHLGLALAQDGAGRTVLAVVIRTWDGTELPLAPEPTPTDTPSPTTGGAPTGGGGGGAAPVADAPTTDAPIADAPTTDATDVSDEAASPAPAVTTAPTAPRETEVVRHHGPSRVATAVAISQANWERSDVVVLASSAGFADALAGAPLAVSHDAPLLLNPVDVGTPFDARGLAGEVSAELDRLRPTTVILLGGRNALSVDVATELAFRHGVEVQRLAGPDRFATAAAIGDALRARHGGARAWIVEGRTGWADAVSAAAVAGWANEPILLVERGVLPQATADFLRRTGITDVTIVGGRGKVGDGVVADLAERGVRHTRLRGPDRYATSAAVATQARGIGMDATTVWLATGRNFPDALAAAPAAARTGATVLLIDGQDLDRSPASLAWLDDNGAGLQRLVVAGGRRAISDAAMENLRSLVR